jgi:hypothetical protein
MDGGVAVKHLFMKLLLVFFAVYTAVVLGYTVYANEAGRALDPGTVGVLLSVSFSEFGASAFVKRWKAKAQKKPVPKPADTVSA